MVFKEASQEDKDEEESPQDDDNDPNSDFKGGHDGFVKE